MKAQNITFKGHSLATFSNENAGATPILFLHGNSSSSKVWERQFNSFLNDKYHLIAFDFLGFGDSDHSSDPDADYSITALTGSVLAVIDYYNLTDFFLVGHSLGGHVIVQTLDRIQGCKGIMTMGSPPIMLPPDVSKIYQLTAPLGVMFEKDYLDIDLDGVRDNFFLTPEHVPPFFMSDFKKTDGWSRKAIGAILASTDFRDEVVVLGDSTLPKSFVSGEHERSINNPYYDSLNFKNTWREKLHRIPEASHFPQWENADVINELIDQFVQENM